MGHAPRMQPCTPPRERGGGSTIAIARAPHRMVAASPLGSATPAL